MKHLAAAAVMAAVSSAAAATPHLDLDVSLDPGLRELHAQAEFRAAQLVRFRLAAGFDVLSVHVDGKPTGVRRQPDDDGARFEIVLPADRTEHQVRVRYRGFLAPLDPALTHRQTLSASTPVASAEGAFLPAGSGWYPEIDTLFTWRLSVRSPENQVAVAPGAVQREDIRGGGRTAVFAFEHPSQGVDLFLGPYSVSEQQAEAAGRTVLIRTYFHEELQPLAAGYLEAAARFIARYSSEIGPYPYSHFSIVSSPLPTGFGMPSLTYLGRDVLRLPFIRDTSLGHEILHNWWGNGVYVDASRGNWSEGLTTFMSDYAYQEDSGPDAARDMRHGWLRDYAALAPGSERPLVEFRARFHSASSVIGYGKTAMMFLALRERLGEDRWRTGLRAFWERYRFRTASFDDLAGSFIRAGDDDLSGFFAQWLERTGAPLLTVREAGNVGGATQTVQITLAQQPAGVAARVPIRIFHDAGQDDVVLMLSTESARSRFAVPARASQVMVDPDFTLWRRLHPSEAPPILRDVQAAAQASLIVLDSSLAPQAAALAHGLVEGQVVDAEAVDGELPSYRLVVGPHNLVDHWLAQRKFPGRPVVALNGDAQVWIAADAAARLVVVSLPARVEDARLMLEVLARRLPHLTRYSWLTFQDGKTAQRGNWPVESPRFAVK